MTEDYCSFVASSTSDVHKVRVGGGDQSFEFVLLFLGLVGGMEKIKVHVVSYDCKYIIKWMVTFYY